MARRVHRPRLSLPERPRLRASALVAVLWCLVFLSAIALSSLHTTRIELRVAGNQAAAIQAHYLALAGLEKAKALIYRERQRRERAGRDHGDLLLDGVEELRDVRLGAGLFHVFRQANGGPGARGIVYGLSDEESRLDINTASREELLKLPGMTSDLAAAILDWRDPDGELTPEGAEADVYASLAPPYRPRNGPFESIAELLMVRGVSPDLLFGEDANHNGLLDPQEDDGTETLPPDNGDGRLDRGWSAHLTSSSSVRNVNARGERRVNITTASAEALAAVDGITAELAQAIVKHRERRSLESIADLLDVTRVNEQEEREEERRRLAEEQRRAARPEATGPAGPEGGGGEGREAGPEESSEPPRPTAPASQEAGEKLCSLELLKEIADHLTTQEGSEIPGAVNINTASITVLSSLPGASEELAWSIASHRERLGSFSSIADLLDVPGMTREVFKQLAGRATVRSETYRILAEGIVPAARARKRLEAVVRLGDFDVLTLEYREDTRR